jgi:hypothetical protein
VLSAQQRQLYVNAVNFAGYARGILGEAINDLDRKLTNQQLALLNEINSVMGKLQDVTLTVTQKLEDVFVIIENAPTRIPGAKDYPTPSFYSIPLITRSQNRVILIEIKGVQLNHKDNHIIFAGKKIPAIIESDKKLTFNVSLTDRDIFNHEAANTFEVVLFEKKLVGKDKAWKYTSRFVVVPENIGVVRMHYKVRELEREGSMGHSGIVHATSGSNSTKEVHRQFNVVNPAAEGWKIDRNSISVRKIKGSGSKHGAGGPYSITEISFVAKAYAKKGKATAEARWNEYRNVSKEVIKVAEIEIGFNQQEVVALPDNLVSLFKTEILYFDGSTFVSSDASFKRNYVAVDFKQLQKVVEVRFAP